MYAAALRAALDARLAAVRERAQQLARSRASDERRVSDLAELLERWLIHGRPQAAQRMADRRGLTDSAPA